ncbi:DUF1499 domain-containing protein [Bacillaceae bacterium IKA-2]|nr:DUF1499 domain-containing protein [Bacillaceae bacterium IKA-2]
MSYVGIKDTLNKYTSKHTETRETHSDEALKTRYYKAMKDKAFNELITMFNDSNQFEVKSTSNERGEMIVTGIGKMKVFIIATVIMVTPNRTAIDFAVSTEIFLPTDFGHSAKIIKEIYKQIDSRLEYIGSGLGA